MPWQRDHDWYSRAACSKWSQDLFFYEAGSRRWTAEARAMYVRAKVICEGCPVRRECLEAALTHETTTLYLGLEEFSYTFRDKRGTELGSRVELRPFTVSGMPPAGVWGGFGPTERHDKSIKHLETRMVDGRTRCVRGIKCPGCREVSEWADMLLTREKEGVA